MKTLFAISLLLMLPACAKPTVEACNIVDGQAYNKNASVPVGMSAPGRDGIAAYNNRNAKMNNQRESQFAFHTKGTEEKPLTCSFHSIPCMETGQETCQEAKCEVTIQTDALVRVIDGTKIQYFKANKSTYMNWDGKQLKCK